MSSVEAMRAISVLWLDQKLDWEVSSRLFLSRFSVSWWFMAFSRTFTGNGRSEMRGVNLEVVGVCGGFL